MKFHISLMVAMFLLFSCNETTKKEEGNVLDVHQVTVQEVLHVKEYSYIRVLEEGEEKWIAAPTTAVEIGGTYYIGKTMEMKNFESKDLNKSFETIYFVEKISATAEDTKRSLTTNPHPVKTENPKPIIEKKEVTIEASGDATSIAELIKNKEKYNNTIVKIRGEVTKFNPAIMNTNWIHIQDGTAFNDLFDLTITSPETVQVGDVVTLEGKVTLNKDFGAGYFYDIIIENAILIK